MRPPDELFLEKESENIVHVHFLHKHVPLWAVITALAGITAMTVLSTFFYAKESLKATQLLVLNSENEAITFTTGSWPALQNAYFFDNVKQNFISQKADFIEADLSTMTLRVYQKGIPVKEAQIISKGREGSWWETPAGLYQVKTKSQTVYSSFGRVYMPWSLQFQGNFFIHGWPYFPDGTPVPQGHSGGCIRLSTDDAKEIYSLAEIGLPVLVFEKSFNSIADNETPKYEQKKPQLGAAGYLAADLNNNFILAENLSGEPHSIASITKLVTALVAVEYINVEHEITINSSMIASTSIPRLQKDEHLSVLDLLSLLLMESSNEAALAIPSALGINQFVELMNKKCAAIGMKNTRFTDTSGVMADNVSTAEDLFMLAKYLYHNRSFILNISMGEENRSAYEISRYSNLSNLNLIPGLKGMVGAKTGTSSSAQESMLAVFEIPIGNEVRPVAIIVLGSKDRKKDIETLYQYIQSNFEI